MNLIEGVGLQLQIMKGSGKQRINALYLDFSVCPMRTEVLS